MKLLSDREFEASILFPMGSVPDLTLGGFLTQSTEIRARLVRFLMQNTFENPVSIPVVSLDSFLLGSDSLNHSYYVLKDTSLDVGCWRFIGGDFELVATDTAALMSIEIKLRSSMGLLPNRTAGVCCLCRKRVGSSNICICIGCKVGTAHKSCVLSDWVTCSVECSDLALCNRILAYIEEIEPLQKAAMRKRRRMNHELSNLGLTTQVSGTRVSSRGRVSGNVDYSFREFDEAITHAIRKSEKKSNEYIPEYEKQDLVSTKTLTRDERMALRRAANEGSSEEDTVQGDTRTLHDTLQTGGQTVHDTVPTNTQNVHDVAHAGTQNVHGTAQTGTEDELVHDTVHAPSTECETVNDMENVLSAEKMMAHDSLDNPMKDTVMVDIHTVAASTSDNLDRV